MKRFNGLIPVTLLLLPLQAAGADPFTFCTSARPSDPIQAAAYDTHCPTYLSAKLAADTAAAQSSASTTELTQQQAQLAVLTSLAGLSKQAPPSVPAQGFDVSGLAGPANLKDAQLTYQVATSIGKTIKDEIGTAKVLVIVSAESAALLDSPVGAPTVANALDTFKKQLDAASCPNENKLAPLAVPGGLAGLLGLQALISVSTNIASLFQPSILASASIQPVKSPDHLLVAGLVEGLGTARANAYLRAPRLTADNKVLSRFGEVELAITRSQQRIAPCDPKHAQTLSVKALIGEANNYLATLTKTDGAKPSILDIAARRSAIEDADIQYSLFMSRDSAAGGISAVKPHALRSAQLLMGTSVAVSYHLVHLSGVPKRSGLEVASWSDRKDIDDWPADKPSENRESSNSAAAKDDAEEQSSGEAHNSPKHQ